MPATSVDIAIGLFVTVACAVFVIVLRRRAAHNSDPFETAAPPTIDGPATEGSPSDHATDQSDTQGHSHTGQEDATRPFSSPRSERRFRSAIDRSPRQTDRSFGAFDGESDNPPLDDPASWSLPPEETDEDSDREPDSEDTTHPHSGDEATRTQRDDPPAHLFDDQDRSTDRRFGED